MANKITQEQIIEMNRQYLKIGTYAGVARIVGVSVGTVKKYIIPDFVDPEEIEITEFDMELPPIEEIYIPDDWGDWCLMTDEEKEKMSEFWKELVI